MDTLSVLGSIASILGAIWAWKEATSSKKSANQAKKIKDQLISHRKTSELVELQSLLNTAILAFKKYGVTNSTSLMGSNHNSDAQLSLDFIHKLKEFREYFEAKSGNVADNLYDEINAELARFKNVNNSQKISTHGTSILNSLVSFSPLLKREATLQKEHTVE